MEPWSAVFSAIKTGDTVLDETKRSALIKKWNLLVRSKRKIILFGLSGAGKSQFLQALKHSLKIPDRTHVTARSKHAIEDFPIEFIDTPGHMEQSDARKRQVNEVIKNGVEGIINVVSYGYEENPVRPNDEIFDNNGEIKESFLKLNRKAEIDRLTEWLPVFQPGDFGWVINLVNKADLWWDDPDQVARHYGEGDYHVAFSSICKYRTIVTLPYCAIIKPYYDTSTSGKFGEIQKHHMHEKLIHELLNLLKGE